MKSMLFMNDLMRTVCAGAIFLLLAWASPVYATAQASPTDWAKATQATVKRVWQPPVTALGEGNSDQAIKNLREVTHLQRVLLTNKETHKDTQRFLDQLWRSFERFDLKGMYKILPNQETDWRSLKVYGALHKNVYRVGPDSRILHRTDGVPDVLGDVTVAVKAREINTKGSTHFLINSSLAMGVGDIKWQSVVDAAQDGLNILMHGDKDFIHQTHLTKNYHFHDRVRTMNPTLGKEDVDVLASFWAGFPHLWRFLSSLGQVNDLLVSKVERAEYQQIKGEFRLNIAKLRYNYPDLARHLDKLNALMQVHLKLRDNQGVIAELDIDSRSLEVKFKAYVKDNRLLPVGDDGVVIVNPEPLNPQTQKFTAWADAKLDVLGVVMHLKNVEIDLLYEKTARGARVVSQISKVPEVGVEGYALGIVPTGLINVFIPSSIEGLMKEFMEVACQGNEGKGVIIAMSFEEGAPPLAENAGPIAARGSQIHMTAQVEALDNAMIRIGVGIVNDRIIPEPAASEDIAKLLYNAQAAFTKDLNAYAKLVQTTQ